MTERPTIKKDPKSGRWTATRHRYGFTPGLESNNNLASRADALDWVYRRGPSSVVTIIERSNSVIDGVGPVPMWSPLMPDSLTGKERR